MGLADLRQTVLAAVAADAAFKAATGATATDPRLYFYYQPTPVVDAARPAYVTYTMASYPEVATAVGSPTISFAIWGRSIEALDAVRDALCALLDRKTLTTPLGVKIRTKRVTENESYPADAKFLGRVVHFSMAYLAIPSSS